MKKTRILSLLLSAMMAVSSFPLMASASGAQALAEDITPAFTTAASGAVTNVAAEDGYVSLTDRHGRYASFQYAYNFKYGTRYRVTFEARMTVPSNGKYDFRVKTLTKGTPEFEYYDGANPKDDYHWLHSWKVAERGNETIVEMKAKDPAAGGDNIDVGTVKADGSWTKFSFEYQFIDKPADATADTVLDRVSLFAGKDSQYTQSFDIDDFKLYEKQGTEWVELKSYDFETKPPMNGNVHDSFRAGDSANVNPVGNTVLNWIPAADTAFSRVAGSESVPTSVEFTSDVTLEPGVYVASADLRFAHTVSSANHDNTTVVEIANTLGGVETVAGTAEISNTWKTVTNTIVVYEATTFDGISFTSKGSTKTPANANKAIDYKNVSLAFARSLAPEVSDEEKVTIIDLPEYDFTVDGGAALEPAGIIPASFEFGNKYIRMYGRKNNWSGLNVVTSNLAFEEGKDYYISYDVRASQNITSGSLADSLLTFAHASGDRLSSIEFTATSNKNGSHINNIDNSKWITVEIPYNQSGAPLAKIKDFKLIGNTSGTQMIANDFDNFAVYYYNGSEKVYLYQEDFQDEATGELTAELSAHYMAWNNNERWAGALQVAEDSLYYTANTASVNYTPAEELILEPGVYTFTTEFAYGTHDNTKIKCNSASGGTYNGYGYIRHEVYENLNAYNVSANIALADGQTFASQQVRAGDGWVSPTITFSVLEPTALSSINYTLDAANDIMLKNAKLTCGPFDVLASEDENNFLDGATYMVGGASYEEFVVDEIDGYLNFPARVDPGEKSDAPDAFFDINTGKTVPAGTAVYYAFDIKSADFSFRPRTHYENVESEGMNGKYVHATANSETVHNNHSTYVVDVANGGEYKHYEGVATTKAETLVQFQLSRGPDFYGNAFEIDNIKIWYMDGDNEVVLYENALDEEGDAESVVYGPGYIFANEGETNTHVIDYTHTKITPYSEEKPVNVIYQLDIPEEEAIDADYLFKAIVKTEEAVAEDVKVKVIYTYDDDSTQSKIFRVNEEWSELIWYREVADKELVSVTINFTAPCALMIRDASLRIVDHKDDGMPNIGIIMMLLHKKGGASNRPVKTEFITDGALNNAPIIHDMAAPKQQTVADAGFYTKLADTHPTKITHVTEDGNSFVRISDLDAGQRGIMYNTGVELQPGTYTFTVDLRVSEKENEPNYTAYGWRTDAKDSMMMRTILQNPNNVGSGNYATSDPVDKDTVMNPDGVVTSSQIVVTREWTTYTDTIVLEKPTVAIFKIGGGMSGNPDAHGYDIDNLSLIGYVVPEAKPDYYTEDVEGNLIVNGDFDEKPTVESGAYDEAKKNTWFENDGDGYELDEAGKEIKDKPIFIDHKIDWTDGYLTFSGRTNNLRQFYYNSGVTLEPGNYTMTLDFKTAKDGESCSVRVGVAGLFNPTTSDALAIDNTWKTMTINFEVKEPTEVRLNFWGGPGAVYKKDFCVDNIVLVKN